MAYTVPEGRAMQPGDRIVEKVRVICQAHKDWSKLREQTYARH